jgi:hypothetical protein
LLREWFFPIQLENFGTECFVDGEARSQASSGGKFSRETGKTETFIERWKWRKKHV